MRQNGNIEKSFGHRYIEDEDYQGYGRQGKMGQDEPNSKGYNGVLFFEEEDDNVSKANRIRNRAHAGPYDDDDDEGDDEIESEDLYQDNDDYNVESFARRRRNRSLYE